MSLQASANDFARYAAIVAREQCRDKNIGINNELNHGTKSSIYAIKPQRPPRYVRPPCAPLLRVIKGLKGPCSNCFSKEAQIYSVLSFPRRREPSQIKALDPRLRGDDELIRVSLAQYSPRRAQSLLRRMRWNLQGWLLLAQPANIRRNALWLLCPTQAGDQENVLSLAPVQNTSPGLRVSSATVALLRASLHHPLGHSSQGQHLPIVGLRRYQQELRTQWYLKE